MDQCLKKMISSFLQSSLPPPFNQWTSGKGTIGLFVKMDFSNIDYIDACKYTSLHKKIFGVTSAHVVFSELSTASLDQAEEFNKINRICSL